MSANFLNLHIEEGEPLGVDADYVAIAEYYTERYIELKKELQKYKDAWKVEGMYGDGLMLSIKNILKNQFYGERVVISVLPKEEE